jgi:DNA modification methylase
MSRSHPPRTSEPARAPSAGAPVPDVARARGRTGVELDMAADAKRDGDGTPSPLRRVSRVAVEALVLYPGNPRRGAVDAIAESLRRHGQLRPAVINTRDSRVLIGNHMLLGARKLGWVEIDVIWVDLDDDAARRLLLLDNRLSDIADYDVQELLAMLSSVEDLDGTGYEQADIDELLDGLAPPPLDEDVLMAVPAKPITQPGELIELGEHRLICGDARDPQTYERLLGDEQAGLLWTDPPYGVEYVGKTARRLRIANDSSAGLASLLGEAFAAINTVMAPGAGVYVAHPAGPLMGVFVAAFLEAGWLLRQSLVWVKDSMVMGRSDYHYRHEPILYGYKPALAGRLGRGGAGWHGDNRQTSVFEIDRPRSSSEHPTMKPVELIEIALRNSSARGAVVLDPFAGSGSTLVAAERTGRRARLVELDPGYADVVIARYEALTGATAERRAA